MKKIILLLSSCFVLFGFSGASPQPGDYEFIGPLETPQPGDYNFIGPLQVGECDFIGPVKKGIVIPSQEECK